jgi:hypothetical protein
MAAQWDRLAEHKARKESEQGWPPRLVAVARPPHTLLRSAVDVFQHQDHLQRFAAPVTGERSDVAVHCPCRHSTQATGPIVHSGRKDRVSP